MMDFYEFFKPALPALEQMQGLVNASYTPSTGPSVPITGFWQPSEIDAENYEDARFERKRGHFVVRKNQLSNPLPGDMLLIGSTVYVIQEEGIVDDDDGTFELGLVTFDQEHSAARKRGIER